MFSPDVIPCGWLGSKHQLTNFPCILQNEYNGCRRRCVYEKCSCLTVCCFLSRHLYASADTGVGIVCARNIEVPVLTNSVFFFLFLFFSSRLSVFPADVILAQTHHLKCCFFSSLSRLWGLPADGAGQTNHLNYSVFSSRLFGPPAGGVGSDTPS